MITETQRDRNARCMDPSGPCVPLIRYIMLKSYHNMIELIMIHYDADICKQSSQAGGGEACIVENLCMVLWVTYIATLLWRHNESGVAKSTKTYEPNICKRKIFWSVHFASHVAISFYVIDVILNTNSTRFVWNNFLNDYILWLR